MVFETLTTYLSFIKLKTTKTFGQKMMNNSCPVIPLVGLCVHVCASLVFDPVEQITTQILLLHGPLGTRMMQNLTPFFHCLSPQSSPSPLFSISLSPSAKDPPHFHTSEASQHPYSRVSSASAAMSDTSYLCDFDTVIIHLSPAGYCCVTNTGNNDNS